MRRSTTLEHVHQVVAIDDRVLRNYWVTQTYADLSSALAQILSPGTTNWCTFGTWASRTVGANMRGEALPAWLHDRVMLPSGLMGAIAESKGSPGAARWRHVVEDFSPEHVLDVVRELLGAMAINLSDGNTEVFAEIAPPAAVLLANYDESPDRRRAATLAYCEDAVAFEGVNRLKSGYDLWCDALECDDPIRRGQLILAGSIQLGVHEQNHLQPVIVSSMDMGVNQAAARVKARLTRERTDVDGHDGTLDDVLRPGARAVGDLWDDVMTCTLGTLQSPEGTMRLDHDVPALVGQPFVPESVSPTVVDELATLTRRFDRSRGDGRETRAIDWANFDDRMNFIANLFISRHRRAEFFDLPFDAATVASLEADQRPIAREPS